MVDHEEIILPYGVNKRMAHDMGVPIACFCRYLKGQFRDNNKNIELIQQVREQARRFEGTVVFLTRNIDGTLKYWRIRPRKIATLGEWMDILDEKDFGLVVPEWMIPKHLEVEWEDKEPKRVLINHSPHHD